MSNKNIFRLLCLLLALSVFVFFVFRSKEDQQIKTEYIPGQTIKQSVDSRQFSPVEESMPAVPVLPMKEIIIEYRDTGSTRTKYIFQTVDTAEIISNYLLKRSYQFTAFDNKEHGRLLLFPTVQYNTLTGLNYEFTPVHRQTTTIKQKHWMPFIGASYSTFNHVGIGGGIFYHNIGLEYQYQRSYLKAADGHTIGVKYRF